MAVSAGEFDNHRGNTISDNSNDIRGQGRTSENYFDDTPGRMGRLSDYEILEEPRKITTAGKHDVEGDPAGAITRAVIDKAGVKQPVKTPIVAVPGLGRNLFSVPRAALQGAITTVTLI